MRNADLDNPTFVNAISHFYRGELGRMMVWRERFDTTTNWAIIGMGSLIAFAVGTPRLMNLAMLLNLFVLGFFAFIEARRFQFYDAFRARVRMLESHYIAPMLLGGDHPLLEGPWREQLAQDLVRPTFKCSFLFALGRRFRRSYFALHLFVLMSWCGLVLLQPGVVSLRAWVEGFGIERVHGGVVLGVVCTYYLFLMVVLQRGQGLRAESNEMQRRPHDLSWEYGRL